MDLYEYQGKELFKRFGIPVSEGRLAVTPDEARLAAEGLGGQVVVKAQVLTGGRGKAGGVKLAENAKDAEERARAILGLDINGHVVHKLWIERASDIAKEYYLSIAFDRGVKKPLFMLTKQGGVDIEEVAAKTPQKIVKVAFSPSKGLAAAEALRLVRGIGIRPGQEPKAATLMTNLAKLFLDLDASIAEVNPLIVTNDGQVMALDAKVVFDDNGIYRHPELLELRDLNEEDEKEIEAAKHDLSYIALDGNIGCMVNGAGLAMATMDVIKLHGAEPANFLDVGGGATTEKVTAAFRLLLSDPHVKGVLVNIFGGIMKCDVIAAGVIEAVKHVELKVPLVVRLEGTNVEKGKELLKSSGLPIVSAADLDDAAAKICKAVAA
jgi:succinyl-CoA synthetase beta subunit